MIRELVAIESRAVQSAGSRFAGSGSGPFGPLLGLELEHENLQY